MNGGESVTVLLDALKAGDDRAVGQIWQKYSRKLILLARGRLNRSSRMTIGEEEDVALSAFNSFCVGAAKGRFPDLARRDNLWRLLVRITFRKARKRIRAEQTLKRGGGQVRRMADLSNRHDGFGDPLQDLQDRNPSPQISAEDAEEIHRLLELLDDDRLREIAQDKLDGYTNEEIAERMDCARQTVSRKLEIIRKSWLLELSP